MGINIGASAISDVKLGTTQVNKIYLGSTELWSKTPPGPDPTAWSGIQQIVRNGQASTYFNVGDEINVACPWVDPSSNTEYAWKWLVADIGTTYKESDPSTAVPCMTLISKYTTPTAYMFDNIENTLATEETAQADIYYYGRTASQFSRLSLAVGDTIPYSSYLNVYKSSLYMNSSEAENVIYRYGYSSWEYSNVRQWLNSTGAANNWFIPSHVGDTAPDYSTKAGFLTGFSSEFQSVLTPTQVASVAPKTGVLYYTYDKMFLPSNAEVNAVNPNYNEGSAFAIFPRSGNSGNADRVKYRLDNQSTASGWRTRSYSNIYQTRYITSGGDSNYSDAVNTAFRLTPCCRIC